MGFAIMLLHTEEYEGQTACAHSRVLAATLPLRKPDHRRLWINRSDTPYGTLYQQAIRSTAGVGAPLAGLNCAATRAERHQPIAMDAGEIAERECPGGNLVRRQQRRSPDLLGLNFRSIIARYAHFPCRLPPRSSPSAHPAGIAIHSGYGQSYASLRALLAASVLAAEVHREASPQRPSCARL